jgi:ribosome recycling factor
LPFYIVGDKPSPALKALAERYPHIKLFDHLSTDQISELISQAQINVLPTFQNTGIKLKLINVLYQGRFVIANDMMVKNTGLENLCTVANTAKSIIEQIEKLMEVEFSMNNLQERKMQLTKKFNNQSNVTLLLTLLD